MSMVQLQGVTKHLSGQAILHAIDLQVEKGELVVVIGPSGSGKSTLLRLIAGLDHPTSGHIWMNGCNVQHVPPAKRDIAMVFQNFALYPHMTVFENMAYGLKIRRHSPDEINKRVHAVALSLGLTELLKRKPQALSGGQQQRVAMGRALVKQPGLFLFDEPLSNLDFTLKGQLRAEIQHLHQSTHITSIYVTHDQVEAMSLATRILLLNQGRVEQFDTPTQLYYQPASLFVGTFFGLHAMNLLSGWISEKRDCIELEARFKLPLPQLHRAVRAGEHVWVGIRPEDMRLAHKDEGGLILDVKLLSMNEMGADRLARVLTEHHQSLLVRLLDPHDNRIPKALSFNALKAHLFLASSGERIGGWDA